MFRKDTCFTVLVHYGKDAPGAAIMKVFDIIACSYFPVVGARISGQQDLDHNRFIFVAEDPGHLKDCLNLLADELEIARPIYEEHALTDCEWDEYQEKYSH